MINPQKYIDIAYKSPRGIRLVEAARTNWRAWLRLFEDSFYSSRWKDVKHLGITPWGEPQDGGYVEDAATLIFETMVWGYGVDNWANKPQKVQVEALRKLNRQGARFVEGAPPEFILFDKWLDSLV